MGEDKVVISVKFTESVAHTWSIQFLNVSGKVEEATNLPLYLMVAKLSPTKFGSKNVFLVVSQVPSPTVIVLEVYVLLPAGAMPGGDDIAELVGISGGAHPIRAAASLNKVKNRE